MENENVETPSVETPVVETPNENPEVPVTPAEPTVETPVAEEKFKLPDGQEVTSQQLYDLHVNKLLPDYTRKSQKLAEYEHINKPKEEVPAWKNPEWQPQSYDELIETAKRVAIDEMKREKQTEEQRTKEATDLVDSQIAEIRKIDAKVDENALFQHANTWGFKDLVQAHKNMQAIKQSALEAEQRTLKNLKARGNEPIAVSGAQPVDTGAVDYSTIANLSESALDFLRRIKG